jgi:uncharacterized protein (DUF305 family)
MPAVRRAAAAALAAFVLAACTDAEAETDQAAQPRGTQPGARGEPSVELDPDEVPAIEEPQHTDADVAFAQGMIPHHVQALRMTRLVPDRTSRDDLPLFSERMDISQEDEIELLRRWLEERDEEVPALTADHDHEGSMEGTGDDELMPGMLTEDELLELEAADGEEFDRLFVQFMIRHHQGAMRMVDELFAEGGGAEPQLAQLANHIRSDQEIEISRMESMLADMGA